MEIRPNVIAVKLMKREGDGLGFLVKQRSCNPPVIVSDVVRGGAADQSGLIQVGDLILSVNGTSLETVSYSDALQVLRSVEVGKPTEIILRGPEGFATKLETTFTGTGIPKTVRITTAESPLRSLALSPARRLIKRITGNSHVKSIDHINAEALKEKETVSNGPLCTDHTDQKMETPKSCSSIAVQTSPEEPATKDVNGQCNGNGTVEKLDKTKLTLDTLSIALKRESVNGNELGRPTEDGPSSRRNSTTLSPSAKPRYARMKNWLNDKQMTDTLHNKGTPVNPCSGTKCLGSLMRPNAAALAKSGRPAGEVRPKEEVLEHAKEFLDEFFASIKRANTQAHKQRWAEAKGQIEEKGWYELTQMELTYGAKLAWRNAPRCVGRIQWSKLQVFDARYVTTARGMYEAICNHIKYATNKGNLRSAITIFPARTDGKHDFKVWNSQFVRYAGYKQPDGSIVGDPASVEFTEICQSLGWKGKNGPFDVLPLVLSANGQDPELFELSKDLVLEVELKHPKYGWFKELGLKWYALPAVANMLFDVGGVEFPAAPFSGWYMCTEIGRDLCDINRYNFTEQIAKRMGLDTGRASSLWRDLALIEANVAILHSFQTCNVTITDHHTACESFMKHMENEQRLRGGCPADWVWIVPPISGSLTPVFHQEMISYYLRPSYEYQEDAWMTHVWKKKEDTKKIMPGKAKRKFGFKEVAKAVKFSAKLMGKALAKRVKATILYATETGKSERYAKTICEIFKHAFDAKVMCMDDYDIMHLEHETLVIVVTSTFGNGDPPDNGESFGQTLLEMRHPPMDNNDNRPPRIRKVSESSDDGGHTKRLSSISSSATERRRKFSHQMKERDMESMDLDGGPLGNVRFSVFGLGSRAYPGFCAFAHAVDTLFGELGGERIYKMGEGDELCGQEESFRKWAKGVFKAACDTFCVGDELNMSEASATLLNSDTTWAADKFRLIPAEGVKEWDIWEGLSKVHSRNVVPCRLISRENLQAPDSGRETILVRLDSQGSDDLNYVPGDHLAVYPANEDHLVQAVLDRLDNAPDPDCIVNMEVLQEKQTPLGAIRSWMTSERLPPCSLRTALSRYFDITTPPSPQLLQHLATQATDEEEKKELEVLGKGDSRYEDWKFERTPNLVEVLEDYPSLKVAPTLLLSQLPFLQQRYYSISSSQLMYPGEIHATVAVVKFATQGGVGPIHNGVCSSWLNRIEKDDIVPCFVRAAQNFHLPEDPTVPLMMVGPGTGIAPFRSFWQHRQMEVTSGDPHHRPKFGQMTLVFGCRQSKMDDIYKHETAQAKEDGALTEVYTALSREPGVPKSYVQNVILDLIPEKVCDLLMNHNGHFYVCGDVSMAADVCNTLEKVMEKQQGMAPNRAKDFVDKLKDCNRYHEDIFGVTLRTQEVTDRVRSAARKNWMRVKRLRPSTVVPPTRGLSPVRESSSLSSTPMSTPSVTPANSPYSSPLHRPDPTVCANGDLPSLHIEE
ncbi:nitric oxide synthase 1-like isoform X2 [Branchiostoma floridae x Branchiostoma japonicum]